MEPERNEASFEGLATIPSELIETEQNVSAVGDHFDASAVTHAMITADGTTVPITLNPETGQFITPDGQTVQVQMPEEEAEAYAEESETVLPDQGGEEVAMAIEESTGTPFQVVEQPQTVVIKEENFATPMIESSAMGGNLQLVSSDGAMYLVNPEMAEAAPTLRIISSNEQTAPTVDETSIHGGKIRIVNSESVSPKKMVINQQQFTISQAKPATQIEKPKVVIRPAIAPKTENKVQYVRVVGSKPIQQATERQVVRLTSSSSLPILPRGTTASATTITPTNSQNVLKIALPSTSISNRQRIILPSESVKVVESQIPNRRVVTMPAPLQPPFPKLEPTLPLSPAALETPKPIIDKTPDMFESTGVKPRKPCNCTKSQCLKLYCECFANGEFCNNCNCNNCFNNLAHEESRQRAIKQCLERNPNAFRPKIGKLNNDGDRRHNKGCNCKRSGCLKNYCECYEAKINCTKNCRCIGCKNIDVALGRKGDGPGGPLGIASVKEDLSINISNGSGIKRLDPTLSSSNGIKAKLNSLSAVSGNSFRPVSGVKQPFNFVTNEVVEATCQCLLAQAEEAERNGQPEVEIEGLIIQEFGRCLSQIIEMANKS